MKLYKINDDLYINIEKIIKVTHIIDLFCRSSEEVPKEIDVYYLELDNGALNISKEQYEKLIDDLGSEK